MRRVFGPKQATHPSVGRLCPVCHKAFVEGDYTMLIPKAPASEDDAAKAAAGLPYTAEALEIHLQCEGGVWRP